MMNANGIDNTFLRVAKIQSFANGQPLTNATGFFYLHDDYLYLVTCRHVVINEATAHRTQRDDCQFVCTSVQRRTVFSDRRAIAPRHERIARDCQIV